MAEEHIVALCNNVDEVVPSHSVAGLTFELREMPPRTAPPPIPPVALQPRRHRLENKKLYQVRRTDIFNIYLMSGRFCMAHTVHSMIRAPSLAAVGASLNINPKAIMLVPSPAVAGPSESERPMLPAGTTQGQATVSYLTLVFNAEYMMKETLLERIHYNAWRAGEWHREGAL